MSRKSPNTYENLAVDNEVCFDCLIKSALSKDDSELRRTDSPSSACLTILHWKN